MTTHLIDKLNNTVKNATFVEYLIKELNTQYQGLNDTFWNVNDFVPASEIDEIFDDHAMDLTTEQETILADVDAMIKRPNTASIIDHHTKDGQVSVRTLQASFNNYHEYRITYLEEVKAKLDVIIEDLKDLINKEALMIREVNISNLVDKLSK